MPDWQELVRQRFADLALDAAEKEEICTEVAAHLQEDFERLRDQGIAEQDAEKRVLAQVTDWNDLRRKIEFARRKENTMPDRVKQLWLPGLLGFVLSMGFLALLQIYGPEPWAVSWRGLPAGWVVYFPWLFSLLPVGAIGAYLSHRAGGSYQRVLTCIVFPVVPYFLAIGIVFPLSLILYRGSIRGLLTTSFLLGLTGLVVLPGIALLMGGLPTQYYLSRSLTAGRTISH